MPILVFIASALIVNIFSNRAYFQTVLDPLVGGGIFGADGQVFFLAFFQIFTHSKTKDHAKEKLTQTLPLYWVLYK